MSSSSNKRYRYSPEYFWRRSINPRLSDDILVSIISLLPWIDAVRTSVLSRRWEKLWTDATGSLEFDCPSFKPLDDPLLASDGEKAEFISWVNNTVRLHQAPTIQEFGVFFCLDASSTSHIDAWIYFAIKKGARKLHLNFTPFEYCGQVYDDETNYHFPNNINNLLHQQQQQQQQQNGAPIIIIDGFSSFVNSLKELSLMHLIVDDEQLVHYLLSSCPHLEKLCLEHLGPAIVNLRVEGPPSLKHLEILEFEGLESFEIISAPNLVFIKYDGKISIKFKSVPKLKQASFEGDTYATYLLADTSDQLSLLSQLESLTLEFISVSKLVWIREMPLLHNLRKLALASLSINDADSFLLFTAQLLKAAPLLHTFVCGFRMYTTGCDRNRERTASKVPRDSHQYLKMVELISFQGHIIDVELATYLLETATSLEKMIIDIEFVEKPLEAKKVCLEQLKEKLPAGTELVIIEKNW